MLADARFHLDRDELDGDAERTQLHRAARRNRPDAFLAEYVRPVLDENRDLLGADVQVNV